MVRCLALLALPFLLPGAADPWAQVKELKTGQELRIIRKGVPRPVLAQFEDLTDENLLVILNKSQQAIPRIEIDRIDARPPQKGKRLRTESRTETKDPQPSRGMPNESRVPSTNSTSSVVIGDKPDFETVYRRTASAK